MTCDVASLIFVIAIVRRGWRCEREQRRQEKEVNHSRPAKANHSALLPAAGATACAALGTRQMPVPAGGEGEQMKQIFSSLACRQRGSAAFVPTFQLGVEEEEEGERNLRKYETCGV